MVEEGSVFFTKAIKTSNDPKRCNTLTAKGNWIGLLLGHANKGAELTPNEFWQLIGNCGLVGLDIVEECLGKKSLDELMAHIKEKYK